MNDVIEKAYQYIDFYALAEDDPNDKNIIFTEIYKDFLKNGRVGKMTEKEARCQLGYDKKELNAAVDAVKKAREAVLKISNGDKRMQEIIDRQLPYEALFRIAY